jgi:hypothetical protein
MTASLPLGQILSKDFRVHICDLTTGNKSTLPLSSASMPAPNAATVEFVNKVCKIQDVTGEILAFPEDGGFSISDEAAAIELVSILDQGIYQQTGMKFSAQFRRPAIEHLLENLEHHKPISFRMHFDESFVEILGKKIQLGPMVRHITGTWDVPFLEVKKWFDEATGKDSYEVIIENAEVVEEFENWPKE